MTHFNVQIPKEIVHDPNITGCSFVLLAKLIQLYYQKGKKLNLSINHNGLKFILMINDNKTLKKSLMNLHEQGYISSEFHEQSALPRKKPLEIKLSKKCIAELNKKPFVQFTQSLLEKEVIESIGYIGVRLLYYYKSYINTTDYYKSKCYVSEDTTAEHLNITRKTIIRYNRILENRKFLKIKQFKLSKMDCEYKQNKNGMEVISFEKYNNHYSVNEEMIDKYLEINKKFTV